MMFRCFTTILLLAACLNAGNAGCAESTGQPILRLETGMHTAMIRRIATDAAGRWLVSASDDKTVRVWERSSGELIKVLRPPIGGGHEGKIYAVALSPDGSTVACGGWTGWERDGTASIYLFDRAGGTLLKRLSGLPNIIKGLAYSPDGRFLAVTLGAGRGLVVLRTSDWRPVAMDGDYSNDSYGLAFDGSGRLATTAWDGQVRLYDREFRLITRKKLPGIERPYDVAFSPDGSRLAVGNSDSARVLLLSGTDLTLLAEPDMAGAGDGALVTVAWSPSGEYLYAAGSRRNSEAFQMRRWSGGGRGEGRDLPLAGSSVQHLLALPDGSLAYAAAGPEMGVQSHRGETVLRKLPPNADYQAVGTDLRLSADGGSLTWRGRNGQLLLFSAAERTVSAAPADIPHLIPPMTTAAGIMVSDWRNAGTPTLNKIPLKLDPFETSRSLAVSRDGRNIILGTDWNLRCFDPQGKQRWSVSAPGTVWGVNVVGGSLLAAAYGDGTIRWHRLEDGRELLALFPHADGKRWVLWSPAGYYDAAPGAEELIGWHLNGGADTAADFFGVARFRGDYYRPDVVSRILNSRDEAAALVLANEGAVRRPRTRSVAKLLPPIAAIVSPDDRSSISGDEALLTVAVRSPSGETVNGLRVLLDGRPVQTKQEQVAGQPDRWSVRVPLGLTGSEIAVLAENRNGVGEPAVVKLRRNATASAEEFAIQPRLYVLAVGVGAYPDKDMALNFAAKDARDFAAELLKQKGSLYRDVTVKVITDSGATRVAVLEGLEWLQRQTTAKDVAVVFLAGHGVNDPNGVYYYLPIDADTQKLKSSAIIFTEIKNSLMALAGKALLFVDTCHSGNIMGARRGATDINAVVNELASAEIGTVVFASSTGRQYSLEDAAWGNGAFTKALLEGLSGKADFAGKGKVTVNMLDLYLSERVKELTDGKQTPTTAKPQTVQDFPIAVRR